MISAEFSLHGKTALVTGDGRWLKYVAAALAEAGADVALAAQNPKALETAAREVRRHDKKVAAIPTVLTRSRDVNKMVEQVLSRLGRIDILINTNDLEFAKPFPQVTISEWRRVIDANLTSLFLCCRAAGKAMLLQKKGRIINIYSCQAEKGLPNSAVYSAAMGGVVSMTRALAVEWGREGITVNAICPAYVRTPLVENQIADQAFARGISPQEVIEQVMLEPAAIKRLIEPQEVAALVVYLCSEAASVVTGAAWAIDLGWTAK